MADVQVSNARRIGFTALALVAFWIAVIAAHRHGDDLLRHQADMVLQSIAIPGVDHVQAWWEVLGSALLPTVFMFLSAHNSIAGLRDPHV